MNTTIDSPLRITRDRELRRIAVTHVITELDTGGAEIMLLRLLGAMDSSRFRSSVITLGSEGPIGPRIRELGIPVVALGMNLLSAVPGAIQLTRELRRQCPDVVQTWLYHADLLGGLASLAVPGAQLAWGLHCGRPDPAILKRSTIWISRLCAAVSARLPARIVCCSDVARQAHLAAGYSAPNTLVIPNGFDTDLYRPAARFRASLREELGLSPDTLLAGVIARFHPRKDHANFCAAARLVVRADPRVRFVLCGDGLDAANPVLAGWIAEAGIGAHCHLLGRRTDIPGIMAALDAIVLSSASEAFPIVLGEAMACGTPCVATDTGDSRLIIGDTGRVVPPGDPAALAAAIVELLGLDREIRLALGRKARLRIIDHFSLAAVARRYEQLYEDLSASSR